METLPLNRIFPDAIGTTKFTVDPKDCAVNSIGNCSSGTGLSYPGNGTWHPTIGSSGTWPPAAVSGTGPVSVGNLQAVGPFFPTRTAAGDFLKIQYAEVEVRCAITRKTVPAGSPVMLIGGMVVSAEGFERWLEDNLAAMIGHRPQDLHTDNPGYDE